jgi:alpha-tubulin suppressor-like RCC1 family protein
MKRLLPLLLLLCSCVGSLVDHNGVDLTGGDGGGCNAATCTNEVPAGATRVCNPGCTYRCPDGQFKAAGGCAAASEISAGTGHTCAVVSGEARCWGANDKGQLGRDIPAVGSFVPAAPTGLTGTVSHIAAGAGHTCAIADGNVWCWGDNTFGQLGNGFTGVSTGGFAVAQVANISGALRIAAGGSHTCAATASQTFCWGNDDHGQLGNHATGAPRPEATEVPEAAGASALAAGESHSCALTASGVLCWGANDAGQVGNGSFSVAVSTPNPTLAGATFLGLGANHSCAGVGDSLNCWGANAAFQVDNSGQNQNQPKGVLSNTRAVTGGAGHTCAVTTNQGLKCWGLNDQNQLGAPGGGSNGDVSVPLASVQSASAGYQHTCAITANGTYCWGSNDRGQLGTDPQVTASTVTPTPISGL